MKPNHYISSLPNLQTLAVNIQNDSSLPNNMQISQPNISCDDLSSNACSYGYITSESFPLKDTQQQTHLETGCITYNSQSASDPYIPSSEYATISSGYISSSKYISDCSFSSDHGHLPFTSPAVFPKSTGGMPLRSFSEEYIGSRDFGDDEFMSSLNSLDDGYVLNNNTDFLTSV